MKKLFAAITLSVLLVASGSCDNEIGPPDKIENFVTGEAFVIGFDPCRANPAIGKSAGYLIATPSQGDTAMTYNLPDSLYEFPKEYFAYYRFRHFFPDSAQDDFPLKLRYRFAGEEEKEWSLCRGDIITPNLEYVKEQIIIICVTK